MTSPALVTVAIPLLAELQVPFEDGVTFVVAPAQTDVAPPNTGFAGMAFIATIFEDAEVHKSAFVTTKVKDVFGVRPVTV